MDRSAEFNVAPHVLDNAKKLGVTGDVLARVKRMVRRSAPLTHDKGNRRFEDFVFKVEGNSVLDLTVI